MRNQVSFSDSKGKTAKEEGSLALFKGGNVRKSWMIYTREKQAGSSLSCETKQEASDLCISFRARHASADAKG